MTTPALIIPSNLSQRQINHAEMVTNMTSINPPTVADYNRQMAHTSLMETARHIGMNHDWAASLHDSRSHFAWDRR